MGSTVGMRLGIAVGMRVFFRSARRLKCGKVGIKCCVFAKLKSMHSWHFFMSFNLFFM